MSAAQEQALGPVMDQYERVNTEQMGGELDSFSVARYRQFARHSPDAVTILDIGCSTGRGGAEYARLRPRSVLWGVDVVQRRLDELPAVYERKFRATSTQIPVESLTADAVLAGEFLEHLTAADVDPTLCEFQRVLKVGGRLLLSTPNPGYLRLAMTGRSVYGPGHLTQHHPRVLRTRLMMHGFSKVRVRGSGRVSRYAGEHFPLLAIYGSYLIIADKRLSRGVQLVRILLSAYHCCPGWGSEPGNGWHWATSLADYGHEVTVLTLPVFREAIREVDPKGIDFQFVEAPGSPLRHISSRLARSGHYLRWQDAALSHVQGRPGRYDVTHHVTAGSLHFGSMLWRLPHPLIFGPIGGGQTAPASYWRYFGRTWPTECVRTASTGSLLKLNRRSRDTVRNSAITLAANSATLTASRRLGANEARFMISSGLPPEWIVSPRTQPSGNPVILWVGRLLARKAPLLAVQAFAGLRREMPARLVIAGDGPQRDQVRAAVKELGLSDDVDLLGQIPWADVRQLYDSASALLFTSLRESFGAPFTEALGRGLPTVSMDHHGMADVHADSGVLKVTLPEAPAELPGLLASALRAVLCDKQWEARSTDAITWAEQLIWPRKAYAATQIYEEFAR